MLRKSRCGDQERTGRPVLRFGESGKIGKFGCLPRPLGARTREAGPQSNPLWRDPRRPKSPLFPLRNSMKWENREIRLPQRPLGARTRATGRHSRWRDPRRPKNPLFPIPETRVANGEIRLPILAPRKRTLDGQSLPDTRSAPAGQPSFPDPVRRPRRDRGQAGQEKSHLG